MSAAQLLTHFDRISDARDAIPRLRRFILDLAVRGKLVEQDPKDEPALELLRRIKAEKARLIRDGTAKNEKPIPPLSDEDVPFQIPSHWAWSQLAQIGFINPRNSACDDVRASFVPMTLISADYGTSSGWEVRPWGEIKTGFTHFAEGDIALAKITPCFQNGKSTVFRGLTSEIGAGTTELHVVRPVFADANFLLIFLKCPHFIETGVPLMTGTAGQKRVSTEYFAYSPFPLPPLPEQHRIVAKVDELMALCDRLEVAQAERESRRDRLAAASLHRLNNGADANTLREHARFHLRHLSRLTTRPEQIQQLRQTILNFAVVGRLTIQQQLDGTASVELRAIESKKREYALRKHKPIAPVSLEEQWCELPNGWTWARWEQITDWITYGFTRPMPHAVEGVPIVTGKNVNLGRIIFATAHRTTRDAYAELNEKDRPQRGDILLTKDGSIGRSAIVDTEEPFCINQSVAVLWLRCCSFDRRFLRLAIECPQTQQMLLAKTEGVAIKHISVVDFGKMVLPLPPLAEQRRIVTKVEELMAVCDRLEAQLTTTQSESRRLLEAVLHQALRPATLDEARAGKPRTVPLAPKITLEPEKCPPLILVAVRLARAFPANRKGGDRKRMVKSLAIAQRHIGVDFGWSDYRDSAGPHNDELIKQIESEAGQLGLLKVAKHDRDRTPVYRYQAASLPAEATRQLETLFGIKMAELNRLAGLISGWSSLDAELYATVYAVWNDLLIENQTASDADIINGVKNWSKEKDAKYTQLEIAEATAYLRREKLMPWGFGPKTRQLPGTLFNELDNTAMSAD